MEPYEPDTDAIDKAIDEAYQRGWDEGREEGYDEGYPNGLAEADNFLDLDDDDEPEF